jgi:hydrogenase nickel incorporation protein HypA/HybF
MHEYSLMRGLLSQVDELRSRHQADRVVSIRLIVGEFSGVEADLLQSAFDDLSQGTPMADADLDIQRTGLSGRCADCESVFAIEKFRFICPQCDSAAVSIHQGEELFLDTVTLGSRETEVRKP